MKTTQVSMSKKLWTPVEKLAKLIQRLLHQNQIACTESVHGGAALATAPWTTNCQLCLEDDKVCRCDKSTVGSVGVVEENARATSSFSHAVINLVGMLIGLGQLSMPYALENGGWSTVFLLVGLGIICAYTSHLLGKCLDKNPNSRSYTDIGEEAYGAKGRIVAAAFIYLEIFMALVSYTISLHDNLSTVFAGTRISAHWAKMSTPQLLTVFAVLVALPSLWLRDLSSISFLSSGGILMSIIIFASVALTAVCGGVSSNHRIPLLQLHKIPAISGLYVFSYAGHTVFPNLHKSMRDPSKFTKVSIVGFTLVTALYTALAFMGAKMFGPNVSSQITLSLPRNLIVTKIALWATVLTPMTKYALEFAPFAIQLEHSLPESMSSRLRMFVRGLVGSIYLLVILVLALSFPYFQYVLGLTGSLVSICICVILPCTFYTKISWPHLSRPLFFLNVTIILFGVILGVFGTISSSKSLIRSLQGDHSA